MAFTTKKYTRPYLIQALTRKPAITFRSYQTLVSALSPRAGAKSAQVTTLATLLGGTKNLRKYFTAGTAAGHKASILSVLKTMR